MKIRILKAGLGAGLLLALSVSLAFAATTANQTVTVTVNAVDQISSSGTVTDVTTRNAAIHAASASDTATISYTTDYLRTISAKVSAGAITGVTLSALAVGCAGTEASEVALTGIDQALITALDGTTTQVVQTACPVGYRVTTIGTATIGASQAVTVTYTIAAP